MLTAHDPGLSFFKNLYTAHVESQEHLAQFEHFSQLQINGVAEWEMMVVAWEQDHDLPNPYVVTKSGVLFLLDATFTTQSSGIFAGVTEADVKLALTKHEADLVAEGIPSLHDRVSASAFVVGGLNLQEQMCVFL